MFSILSGTWNFFQYHIQQSKTRIKYLSSSKMDEILDNEIFSVRKGKCNRSVNATAVWPPTLTPTAVLRALGHRNACVSSCISFNFYLLPWNREAKKKMLPRTHVRFNIRETSNSWVCAFKFRVGIQSVSQQGNKGSRVVDVSFFCLESENETDGMIINWVNRETKD